MPCTKFKVGLRCLPHTFSQAKWQTASGEYAKYLNFYSYTTPCLTRQGWLKPNAQQRLFTQAFMPKNQAAKGTWVQLHGYLDHSASYPNLHSFLLENNWAYLTYDLPGHGLSSGARASIASFDDYQAGINQLVKLLEAENWPKPWVLGGFSTGGSIALQQQLTQQKFAGLVLFAPLVEPTNWHQLSPWVQKLIIKPLNLVMPYLPRKFEHNSSNPSYLNFVQQQDCLQGHKISFLWVLALKNWLAGSFAQLKPAKGFSSLLVQGEADATVSWQANLPQLTRLLPKAKVRMLPLAGHQILNENQPLVNSLLEELTVFINHLEGT